jgi:hypothetical protein
LALSAKWIWKRVGGRPSSYQKRKLIFDDIVVVVGASIKVCGSAKWQQQQRPFL